jgi:hypothetical protein
MSSDAPRLVRSLVSPAVIVGGFQILLGISLAYNDRRPIGSILGVLLTLCAIAVTYRAIRDASTRVTETGISQLTWRGRLHLLFSDVTGMTKKSHVLLLSSRHGRVVVPVGFFENTASAIAYIQARLPSQFVRNGSVRGS